MIVFSMFFSDRYEEDRRARARGWKEHNAGVLALLRARGPEAHISGHGHQMFVDCRLALIVQSILVRKKSPLHTQQWMTVPWTQIPKTPKDTLIDIISGMPSILEAVDWLAGMPKSKAKDDFRKKIINVCMTYDRKLCTWYDANIPKDRLCSIEKTAVRVYNTSTYESDFSEGDALPTEDLSIIYVMSVFYTGCVLLYSTMYSLDIPNLPEHINLSLCLNKIATYLKVFFHPSTGQYGLEMTSWPLGYCLQVLSSSSPKGVDIIEERAMFTQLLETKRGREIGDFLRSMLNTNETRKN